MRRKILLFFKYIYSLTSLLFLMVYLKKKNKMLFISHDMSISGAPLVLKKVIDKVRNEYNLYPIILTLVPGELCFDYIKEGIFPISCQFFKNYIAKKIVNSQFEKIFVNTIVCCEWVKIFEKNNINYIWWIHEGFDYANKYKDNLPNKINNGNVLFVSEYSKNVFKGFGFNPQSETLPYFIKEDAHIYKRNDSKKNINVKKIMIIGSICPRKNQLEVVKAFTKLQTLYKENIELMIIGKSIDDEYYADLKDTITSLSNVSLIEYVANDKMWELYKEADILVCCSTDDPLPVTVTEAFMYGCKAIVGSNCGQYHLILNRENGLSYKQGNIDELIECLLYALDAPDDRILERQFNLYICNFAETTFDKRLKQLMQ